MDLAHVRGLWSGESENIDGVQRLAIYFPTNPHRGARGRGREPLDLI